MDFDFDEFENRWANKSLTPSFNSSGDAYDRCNWDKHMKAGRVFVVESEQIVGIAWAWPLAVTENAGQLHNTEIDPREWTGDNAEPKIAAAVEAAINLAKSKGWPLAAWARKQA